MIPSSWRDLHRDVVDLRHRWWRLLGDVEAVYFLHLLNKPLANRGIRSGPPHWGFGIVSLEVDDG